MIFDYRCVESHFQKSIDFSIESYHCIFFRDSFISKSKNRWLEREEEKKGGGHFVDQAGHDLLKSRGSLIGVFGARGSLGRGWCVKKGSPRTGDLLVSQNSGGHLFVNPLLSPCGELEERNKGVEKSPVCNYWLEFLLPRPTPYRPVLAVSLLPVSPSSSSSYVPFETQRNLFDINLNRGVDIDRLCRILLTIKSTVFKLFYNIFFSIYCQFFFFFFVLVTIESREYKLKKKARSKIS